MPTFDISNPCQTAAQVQALADERLAKRPDAHAAALSTLFDLAGDTGVYHHQIGVLRSQCLEMARRGDRCRRESSPDFAIIKFVSTAWGTNPAVRQALADVFSAYVECGVIEVNRPMIVSDAVRRTQMMLSSAPVKEAIMRGCIDTAEQLVMHGCNVDPIDDFEGGTDLVSFARSFFSTNAPTAPRTDDTIAEACARLTAALLKREIDSLVRSHGPGPDASGVPLTPQQDRRPRRGL
ncbi:hypothetical protein ABIC83_002744 [Roseateles asaccharophilus]|uniref:hypothetical protein n=1 Tax=Roseateles asaccharophilus TaxID=582607 RepID=UPI003837529A